MKKTIKYSILGLAALCTVVLCGKGFINNFL